MTNVWCSRMQAVIKSKLITRFFVVFLAPFPVFPKAKGLSFCCHPYYFPEQSVLRVTPPFANCYWSHQACAFPWHSPEHVWPQWPWAHCRLRDGGLPCWRSVVEKLLIKNKILPSVTSLTWQLNQMPWLLQILSTSKSGND